MSTSVICACGKAFAADDRHAGRSVSCPRCRRAVAVPAAPPEPVEAVRFDDLDFGAYDVAGGDDDGNAAAPRAETGSRGAGLGGTFAAATWSDQRGGTYASNPGNISIDPILCLRNYPLIPLLAAAGVAGGVVLGMTVDAKLYALAPIAFVLVVMELNKIAARCRSGDVNAGVVVATAPYMVATITDLGKHGRAFPAVKVFRAPLGNMTGGPPRVGARVTTASHYVAGLSDEPFWLDFDPVVTETVTGNAADVRRLKGSIPAAQWLALERAVPHLPPKFGLYRLWEPDCVATVTRRRARDVRGLAVLGVLVVAIALVIYNNQRPPRDEVRQPAAKRWRSPPVSSTLPPVNRTAAPAVPFREPPERWSAAEIPDPPERPVPPGLRRPPERPARPSRARPQRPAAGRAAPGSVEDGDASATPDAGDAAEAPATPAGPRAVYKAGQSVEVLWGRTWFASKILKREGRKYRIHYEGWSDSFDEWVTADRIRAAR